MPKLGSSLPARETIPFAVGCRFIGVSTVTGLKLANDPTANFPRPFRIGGRRFFRSLAQLQVWLDEQAASAAANRPLVMGGASAGRTRAR